MMLRSAFLWLVVFVTVSAEAAQPATQPVVYKARVVPHWTDDSHFWYRNDLADGAQEFVTVDAATGTRSTVAERPASSRPATRAASTPSTSPVDLPTTRNAADDLPDPQQPARSPDGQSVAIVRDHNVCVGTTPADAKPLSTDGTERFPYDRVFWSPDGRSILAYRVERGDHLPVYRLESSPRGRRGAAGGGVGRAVLRTDEYTLPGDDLDSYEINLFDVETGRQTKPPLDRIDCDEGGEHPSPRPRWRAGGRRFTYEKYDRGHQRVRLIEVDALTGSTRTLLDEKSDTFICSAYPDSRRTRLFNYVGNGREVVYLSERSGWRHLYLLDLDTADLKPITTGAWPIRGIGRVDPKARQVIFSASGIYPGQDPYLVHYGRVNFDGSGLTWLTDANGNHAIDFARDGQAFSPNGDYLVVTHSRVDVPPVTELRRTTNGKLVTVLERAEVVGDWRPLETFTAKGRDGATDICGVIRKPKDFDPAKKYPVVENVYAGPHSAYVPKSFRPVWSYDNLADRGFIVVQVDGMGTAQRGKAFHDVCWKNLADAGFPDRIAWIKAAAASRPWMDLSRVGIMGTSAGGQNAAAAMMFHNDFYKAAVANCGCHDNRMDKISWNEQWMGWPVGPQYSACSNIDNAGKLKGRLMLVLGELDANVPVESTYRFIDALTKAGKDFDFVLIPGAGHGAGSPVTTRKTADFFVRHLQGVEPANPN